MARCDLQPGHFLSSVDAIFESSDMCALLGVRAEVGKLVRGHEKAFQERGDNTEWCKGLERNNGRGAVKWANDGRKG